MLSISFNYVFYSSSEDENTDNLHDSLLYFGRKKLFQKLIILSNILRRVEVVKIRRAL